MLIGLMGEKFNGKSLIASYLTEKYNFQEFAFANPLKEGICAIFGLDPKYVWDPNYKETEHPDWKVSGRQLMQIVGTEMFRAQLQALLPNIDLGSYRNLWIRNLELRLKSSPYEKHVISDVRFPDEATFIKEHGGILVRVIRPSMQKQGDSHSSESSLNEIKVDVVLQNSGTKDYLYEQIRKLIIEQYVKDTYGFLE